MYAVSQDFLAALRASNRVVVAIDAWRGGRIVGQDLPLDTENPGQVQVDGTSNVRRQLQCQFVREPGLWDLLAPVGTELRPRYGVRFVDGQIEWCPLGVFVLDSQAMGTGPGGATLRVTAPDRWVRVQRAAFVRPRGSRTSVRTPEEIMNLVREAVPEATTVRQESTYRGRTPTLVWERSREDAINGLRTVADAEAFFDADGGIVVRDATRDRSPVWTIDAGAAGVLVDADRARDRRNTFSVVVVTSTAPDGARFDPVIIRDTDPSSSTYYRGPFGEVVDYLDSPTLRSKTQAIVAGRRRLDAVAGVASQVTGTAVPNPALDAGDAVDVLMPPEAPGGQVILERHLIEAVTTPLGAGAQTFRLRSSRPDSALGVE